MASNYLDYDKSQSIGMRLIRSGDNPTFGLLVIVGTNFGLRISDLLKLTFKQLRSEQIELIEGKTGKKRIIKVNDAVKDAVKYFDDYNDSFYVFRSQKGTVYSSQHINRLMKKYFTGNNISSHSLRKCFGRRVWDAKGQTDAALIKLSQVFNHSNTAITRRYLGLQQEEINDIYMSL